MTRDNMIACLKMQQVASLQVRSPRLATEIEKFCCWGNVIRNEKKEKEIENVNIKTRDFG
ncbi:hypothetical protein X777_02077 [Ooceraea biroi]|uniref:Uncharacterized protein n=1 Tax=Ooceraea biroi TaxID=2015173 RepID=A0A026WPG1_OOCBI|nr:hypothetical protein X777_02077 [Ooceraea biroi]